MSYRRTSASPRNWQQSSRYPNDNGNRSSSSSCDDLISALVSKRKLCLVTDQHLRKEDTSFIDTFGEFGNSLFSVVLPRSVTLPPYLFESSHFVYFQFEQRVLKPSYDSSQSKGPTANDYELRRRWAFYRIRVDHEQLAEADQYIKEKNLNNEFFADPAPQR